MDGVMERDADGTRALIAVIDARRPQAWEKVGGIPLPARYLYHFNELGIHRTVIWTGPEQADIRLDRWRKDMELRWVRSEAALLDEVLELADDDRLLYVDAAHLVDPRVLEALAARQRTTLVCRDRRDRSGAIVRLALLSVADLRRWLEEGSEALYRGAEILYPSQMDPFCPEIRGELEPYLIEVESPEDARRVTWELILRKQKQVMDLPAEFIDPPFENRLTFRLCDTWVSPNMVTLFGLLVALGITWLFWHGYFVAGAFGTFVVEILDGVDGKLARTRLQYTRLGQHEDVIDYLYETSWYVALGVGLSRTFGGTLPALLAALMVVSDTVDNVLYTLAGKWYGKSIDLFSPFDAAFRRIGGRRNIYGFMFMIGFSAGYPLETFALAATWAAVTATIHGIRLVQYGRGRKVPTTAARGTR